MRFWQAIGMMVAFVVVVIGVVFLWWDLDVRWRPHEISRNSDQLVNLLQSAGWVSSGGGANKVYLVALRNCRPCERFAASELPALQKAGADVRIVMIAAPEQTSTPAERSTIAELWVNRRWPLLQSWLEAPLATWTAPNVPPADGDAARSAVVETSRDLADRLKPLTRQNGLTFAYPLVVWRTNDGVLEAAAGNCPKTWAYLMKDAGER